MFHFQNTIVFISNIKIGAYVPLITILFFYLQCHIFDLSTFPKITVFHCKILNWKRYRISSQLSSVVYVFYVCDIFICLIITWIHIRKYVKKNLDKKIIIVWKYVWKKYPPNPSDIIEYGYKMNLTSQMTIRWQYAANSDRKQ